MPHAEHIPTLRAALAEYDGHADSVMNVEDQQQADDWTAREKVLAAAASHAFWLCTSDINSRDNCALVRPVHWTRDDHIHRFASEANPPETR